MNFLEHKFEADRLLVIIPDNLTGLVNKGEVTDRYYNPGNLFREVHILVTNDDKVDPAQVQKMAGDAKLYIHNLPSGKKLFFRTLGWQKIMLGGWIKKGLDLAKSIKPDLVRTHNNFIEGYLAKRIKDAMGTHYVISLHGVWDRDSLITPKEKLIKYFRKKFETVSLQNADAVIAVYRPILRYAEAYGAGNVELIYNIVAGSEIERKKEYKLSSPPKLITINRQVKEKNPENIIRAVKDIDCHYLIVGDGGYHDYLKSLASELRVGSKIEFVKAIPNHKLCSMLKDFDLMVSHCDYWGISKTTIEAALAGLPVIINSHPVQPIPDFDGGWLLLCDNSPEAYKSSILRMLENDSVRLDYGQRSYSHAMEYFEPSAMETRTVSLYRKVLNSESSS